MLTEITDETVVGKIYLIRNKKVMLDRDLALLYGIETKALKQAVKRNSDRFPSDFMFEMSAQELADWRSQFVTSKKDLKGLRHRPFCFTEQGVAMLSSVLHSAQAIAVNIRIMRIFTHMREVISAHKELIIKLEQLEKQFLVQDAKSIKHEDEIQMIFEVLKQLLNPPNPPRPSIGFKSKE